MDIGSNDGRKGILTRDNPEDWLAVLAIQEIETRNKYRSSQ